MCNCYIRACCVQSAMCRWSANVVHNVAAMFQPNLSWPRMWIAARATAFIGTQDGGWGEGARDSLPKALLKAQEWLSFMELQAQHWSAASEIEKQGKCHEFWLLNVSSQYSLGDSRHRSLALLCTSRSTVVGWERALRHPTVSCMARCVHCAAIEILQVLTKLQQAFGNNPHCNELSAREP